MNKLEVDAAERAASDLISYIERSVLSEWNVMARDINEKLVERYPRSVAWLTIVASVDDDFARVSFEGSEGAIVSWLDCDQDHQSVEIPNDFIAEDTRAAARARIEAETLACADKQMEHHQSAVRKRDESTLEELAAKRAELDAKIAELRQSLSS